MMKKYTIVYKNIGDNKISDYEEQIYSLKEELEEYKIDN